MNIKIYGTGCPKCKTLAANVVAALAKDGLAAEVEKVTDIDAIVARGILSTPALEIDGEIVASGRVFSPEEVRRIINPEAAQTTTSTPRRKTSALRRIAGAALVAFALVGLVWPFYAETPKRNPFRKPSRNRVPTRQSCTTSTEPNAA